MNNPSRSLLASVLLLNAACHSALPGQSNPKTVAQANKAAPSLMLAPLAGQVIPILPATYLLAADSVPGLPTDHAAQLKWADSIIGVQLPMRGSEVNWMLPAELRAIAKRAPGQTLEPDKLGQSLLRNATLKTAPDQLISNLRPLMAMANARYVMSPASLVFARTPGGVEVKTAFAIVDSRSGNVIYHSEPIGNGATAAAALTAVFARILP